MKFGKRLKRKKVPEWTNAYVDYNGLKRVLGDIARYRQSVQPSASRDGLQRMAPFDSFTGFPKEPSGSPIADAEEQAIDVRVSRHGHGWFYETNFLRRSEGGGEIEARFFEKLDEELNKVNAFFKDKVEEAMQEADSLNRQMDALTALRIKVERPGSDGSSSGTPSSGCSSTGSMASNDIKGKGIGAPHRTSQGESCRDPVNVRKRDPLEILDRVKMKRTLESPVSTLKRLFGDSRDVELRFKEEELTGAKERLKVVFIDFYLKLYQLKQYRFQYNTSLVSTRRAKRSYMEIVDNSYLVRSNKVTNLLERVEAIFITHFSNSNRRKAMASLRPKAKKENHKVTFFTGFFCGCSVALVVAIILRIEARNLMEMEDGSLYMQNVFPLYSLFGYIILHMLMYAANIYFWRLYRIGFISKTRDLKTVTEIVPLVLVVVVLAIIICPLNIVYRSSRIFFMRCIFHCIFAPLYKVTLPDFFLADHLTSQVQTIRCLEIYICYYGLGEYSQRQNKCHNNGVYNTFYFVVAVIPFWFRFMQCLRRLCEEKDAVHAFNGLKYLFTILAVLIRTAFELTEGPAWLVLALLSSIVATAMNTFWDIVMDWGLLRRNSNNFYLRDKLLVSHKSVYYIAMFLNIVLRLAWTKLVLEFNLRPMHQMAVTTVISCLEILRRGIWSFFRLENEHLNNVGKYRAFNSVPHPFCYYDESGHDDDEDDQDSDKKE
ncbi:hypothetical protein MLD38_011923 [Melastoma candidum]|uniref:Uncharacterized protein n=1 Tax=Melastoma candidum TaxID=119954 RepID=A0ACB9R499_9MYRT|nr:hypothetical protein MLD38_011923 [Melastoma candidum]